MSTHIFHKECWKETIEENHRPDVVVRLQTVELGDGLGASCARLTNVPDLDASLAAGVHIFGRIGDRDSAHDLPVAEGINLPRMTRYPLSAERIRWEGHRLHLALARHVEAVRAETSRKMRLVRWTRVCQTIRSLFRSLTRFHAIHARSKPSFNETREVNRRTPRFWSSGFRSSFCIFSFFFFFWRAEGG